MDPDSFIAEAGRWVWNEAGNFRTRKDCVPWLMQLDAVQEN